MESQALGRTFQCDEWYHAIGSHQQIVSGMVVVTPPDQGREGTRADVSRGDEENR
ncbi:hypothetical protein [Streptomyces griseosporeus]|uniref:hypothetical protein n=1 Tax=Streptomyces griseosporeus TaxID=1910 RepID=UPI001E418634|nr:hypothetical protein [Streptomyces griseosporeus]